MSETPHANPQFVGQADARAAHEPIQKDEVILNPEQKQVADVMQEQGKQLENKIIDAREKAGTQLKQLQGKELVDAGLKQMGHGVWETVRGEAVGLVTGAAVGAVSGAILGKVTDGLFMSPKNAAIAGAGLFGATGALSGEYIANLHYNKKTSKEKKLPSTKWYDRVISYTGLAGVMAVVSQDAMKNMGSYFTNDKLSVKSYLVGGGAVLFTQLFNSTTVGGLRNVATGLWQMRKG